MKYRLSCFTKTESNRLNINPLFSVDISEQDVDSILSNKLPNDVLTGQTFLEVISNDTMALLLDIHED